MMRTWIPHPLVLAASLLLGACGGGGSSENQDSPNEPPPQADTLVTDLAVDNITSESATLSFSTAPATAATVKIWLESDDPSAPPVMTLTSDAKSEHSLPLTGLWSSAPWHAEVAADTEVSSINFQTADPVWPEICRTGSLVLPVSGSGNWSTFSDLNGTASVSSTPGCNGAGTGARLNFDLGDGEWVVAQSEDFATAIDLTPYTHLWIPFRGTAEVPVALEIKLRDAAGGLSTVHLDGGVGVPVWRSWGVDLRQFKPQLGQLNLSAVTGIEVAFSWPLERGGPRSGVVELADLQAWNLDEARPEVSGFERVPRDEPAMAGIAADLLARQEPHGFLTAWFDLAPNLHLYANAMALIVFTLEYERLATEGATAAASDYREAAERMADALVSLQSLSDRNGAWDDSFIEVDGELSRRPPGSRIVWVGSTAWAGLAMILARDILPDGQVYEDAIASAAGFYASQQSCRGGAGLPVGSVAEGTEGNISSHLFLAAAANRGLADPAVADSLGSFISEYLFDPVQERFLCGVSVDFGGGFNESACTLDGSGAIQGDDAQSCLDVIANWGTEWLLRQGRTEDALKGFAYARHMFPTRSFNDPAITGLGDIAGPWTPTVEFGAGQWALAGGPDANYLMQQAQTHLCSDGACQGAADNLSAGIGWNTRARGITPAAWMYLGWHGDFWSRL